MNNHHLIESLNIAMATRITPELWAVLVDARDEIQKLNAQVKEFRYVQKCMEKIGGKA